MTRIKSNISRPSKIKRTDNVITNVEVKKFLDVATVNLNMRVKEIETKEQYAWRKNKHVKRLIK